MRKLFCVLRDQHGGAAIAAGVLLAALVAGHPPAAATPAADADRLNDLAQLLVGQWKCRGQFANGKAITSSESFAPLFGGRWLLERHQDEPPFNYEAHALWGFDPRTAVFTLSIYDNFGGQRLFTSHGWQQGALTFEARPLLSPPAHQERFIYKSAGAGYSVEYQILDHTGSWKQGDALECRRG